MLSAAMKIAQADPQGTSSVTVSETRKRKSPKKSSESAVSKRLNLVEASRLECPITKYPAAIRMQIMAGFLVNLSERQVHLDGRALACRRSTARASNFKPVHVYSAASPEMPEPKEKKFEPDYSESAQPTLESHHDLQVPHQNAFEDLPFDQKSKCWSTSFSYKVQVTDGTSLERQLKKLDRNQFTGKDYQSIADGRFLTNSAMNIYLKVSTDEYRESFDVRPRRAEGQMLNAFGIKPMT